MIAFSTCWNNHSHKSGHAAIEEILELGFSHLELSHGTHLSKLPDYQEAYKDKKFTCAGVHNFFPSPVEVLVDHPDVYQFTDKTPSLYRQAINNTLKTFEVAASFEAEYIVLHLGSTKLKKTDWTNKLQQLILDEPDKPISEVIESKKYQKLLAKFIKRRAKYTKALSQKVIQSIEYLLPKAEEYQLKLALESRSHYEQFPTEDEMIFIQEHFAEHPLVGYWHDFGHVERKHHLRLLDHAEWIQQMQPYLIGGHLHDVIAPHKDHQVPFTGTIDYPKVLESFTPQMPLTWELSPRQKSADILTAKKQWEQKFPEFS